MRSMVGLLQLCATTVVEPWQRERVPRLLAHARERPRRRPELLQSIHPTGEGHLGDRLRRIPARILDESELSVRIERRRGFSIGAINYFSRM